MIASWGAMRADLDVVVEEGGCDRARLDGWSAEGGSLRFWGTGGPGGEGLGGMFA